MTVTSDLQDVSHETDGATVDFPIPFYFIENDDIVVDKIDANDNLVTLSYGTDYTVSGAGNQSGGTASMLTAFARGFTLHIYREVPVTQETKYQQNDPFPAKTTETALDKLTMIAQQNSSKIINAIRYPLSEFGRNGVLPPSGARAQMLLGWDANGNQEMVPRPASVGAGDLRLDRFISDALPNPGGLPTFTRGVTTTLTLSRAPVSDANCEAYWDGVPQLDISLDDRDLLFPTPIEADMVVARIGTTLSVGIPAQQSVGEDELIWGAILGRVCSTRAELKALDTTRYRRAFVVGYASAGDGGGLGPVVFDPLNATDDNGGSVTAPNIGSGRWLMPNPAELDVRQFGARGDNVTDDTAAIQACYNAVRTGGVMRIPAAPSGAYLISKQGTNGYCLNFSRPVNIIADGFGSALRPAAGTTVNTVLLKPAPNVGYDGMEWDGIALIDPSTGQRAGANGIFIDTTVEGAQLAKPIFRRLIIGVGTSAAILHINSPTGINANGGMYAAVIDECRALMGGINLQASGDSNTIKRCVMSGPGIGVYASLTSGASELTIEDCNITCTGGSIKIDAGSRTKVLRCNMEQVAPFTGGALYMVDFSGANGTMSMCELRGNHMGLFSGISNAAVVHVSNCVGFLAEANVLLNSNAAAVGFIVDASCNDTKIGANVYGSSVGTRVTDNGNGTMGVVVPLGSFANNWQASPNAPTSTPRRFKSLDGIVTLSGKLGLGTVASGTVMFTLPAGLRPSEPVEFLQVSYAGATLAPAHLRINTDGTAQIIAGNNTELHLDGIVFPAALLSSSTSDL
jgi:hypothetical protein